MRLFGWFKFPAQPRLSSRRRNFRRRPGSSWPVPVAAIESLERRQLLSAATLSVSSPVAMEGDGGTSNNNMVFVVTRSGDTTGDVQCNYQTVDGTAHAGVDYTAKSGTLDFTPGTRTLTVSVPVIGNTIFQPDRAFSLQVSALPSFSLETINPGVPVGDYVAVADINSDGRPDLIVDGANGTVAVLLNMSAPGNDSPVFQNAGTFAVGSNPTGPAIADLNGDGRPDLVVPSQQGAAGMVSVLLNTTVPGTTSVSFTTQTFATSQIPTYASVADVNGDGRPDLIVPFSKGGVLVFLNTTAPGSTAASFTTQMSFAAGNIPDFSTTTDLNGDGRPDLVVANGGSNSISVLLNATAPGATAPSFAAQQTFATGGVDPTSVTAADVNGDGRPDLVVANHATESVAVFLNTTAPGATIPTFAAPTTFYAPHADTVTTADVNGDGRPDLIVTNYSQRGGAEVLLNTTLPGASAPSFTPRNQFWGAPYSYGLTAADLTGDGLPDLIVNNLAAGSSSGSVTVLVNETPKLVVPLTFAPQQTVASGLGPHAATTSDFNGDGHPDLAFVNTQSNSVSVSLGTTAPGATTPSFGSQVTFATGLAPYSVSVADLNGDGRPDLIVANRDSNSVSVLLDTTAPGATTPSFALQQTFTVGTSPESITTADVNGDGRLDILVANYGSNSVSVLLNTTAVGATTPSFAAQQTFATGSGPRSVAVADVNGDGRLDLIVANRNSNSVSVLRNTTTPGSTTPSFGEQQTFATGMLPNWVTTSDVNGDGRPDLIVANYGSNSVSVLLDTTVPGATTPAFAVQQTFATSSGPVSVTAADLNNDGSPDLIVSNQNSNSVSVLTGGTMPGSTTAVFGAPLTFASGAAPDSAIAADLNGDGRPDLIVTNGSNSSGPGTVSVLMNTGLLTTGTILDDDAPAFVGPFPFSGRLQSTTIGAPFATNLRVMVENAALDPVSNVSVTFTAPSSGASGTFAGGTTSATVLTVLAGDGSITATAPAFTANGIEGTYLVSATAAGGSNPFATFVLTNDGPPSFSSAASTTFTAGSPASFTVAASGVPAATLSESNTDELPAGVTFDPAKGILSGTPAAGSAGTYTLHFTAANGFGPNATQTFTLSVVAPVPPIQLVTVAPQQGTAAYGALNAVTFAVSTVRGSGSTVAVNGAYSVTGLPTGVTGGFSVASFAAPANSALPGTTLMLAVGPTVNAGDYTFTVTCADDHGNPVSSQATLHVGKAAISFTIGNDRHAYGSTDNFAIDLGTTFATGINGENLGIVYASSGNTTSSTVAAYDITGIVSDGDGASAGLASNYTVTVTNGTLNVTKANAMINVTPYSVTYDGNTHTDVGTVTGALGEALTGLDLSGTTHTHGGTYSDAWTFTDTTGNYNNASGTVTDVIGQADASITVKGYTGIYDAHAHGASGSATGVLGENLSSLLNLGASFTNVPGGTANWSFAGNADYKAASGSVAIVINDVPTDTTFFTTLPAIAGTATGDVVLATFNDPTVSGIITEPFPSRFTPMVNWNGPVLGTPTVTVQLVAQLNAYSMCQVVGNATFVRPGTYTPTIIVNDVDGESLQIEKTTFNVRSPTFTATATPVTTAVYDTAFSAEVATFVDSNPLAMLSDFPLANVTIEWGDGSMSQATGITQPDGPGTAFHVFGSHAYGAAGATATPLSVTITDVDGVVSNATSYTPTVAKANATIVVTPYSVTYDGSAHAATYTVTGVGTDTSAAGTNITLDTTHTGAGTYSSDSWSFSGGNNYNDIAATTITDLIARANATVTVNGYSATYDASAHAATGTATGVLGETLTGLDLTGTTHVHGGTYSDNWTFTDATGNYNNTSGTVTDTIGQADASISVSGYTGKYDGHAHGATGSATGVVSEDLSGLLNLGASFTNVPGGIANWFFAGNTDYKAANGSVAIVINKADAVLAVTPYSVTYDGNSHTATGTVTGVLGESLTGLDLSGTSHVHGGTYSDNWTFTDATGNYNNTSGTVTDTIGRADASISVSGYTGKYDGHAHGATGSATGVVSEDLSGLLNLGASFTNVPGGIANWFFAGNTDYKAANGSVAIVINKADAVLAVTPYGVTYDGNSHTATGTVTGVLGESLTGLDLSGTTHTHGGKYSDGWTFTDSTGNYNNTTGTETDTIGLANANITVSGYTGAFDGHAHGATGSASGVMNEDLGSLLNLGASFTNVPGGTANWSFAGNTDYKAASGSVAIVINKSDAVLAVTPYGVTYDGNSHTATGTVTGVLGESLTGLDLSGTTHAHGGTYSDTWTFADVTGNYKNATGTVTDTIGQANANITVSGYTGTYDGHAHGATGSATGVQGENLSSLLNLGASFTNVPGGTANWSFAGNTDYIAASGSVAIVITQATATIHVTPYSVTYDGNAHTATGTVTGVLGETLTGLGLSATTHTHAGTYSDGWTFTDTTGNYSNATGTVIDTIGQANANITLNGYNGAYDGHAHGASGSATGVQGENLGSLLNLGASFTNVPGGTANWSFAGNTDYKAASGSIAIVIAKAGTTTTLSSSLSTSPYGQSVTFTAVVTSSAPVNPAGHVDFYDGNTLIGTGALTVVNGHDQATFSTSSLAGGVTHSITAVYSGDGNDQTSTSAALAQTVLSAQQQTAILVNQVNAVVNAGGLSSGNGTALTSTLNNAITNLNGGNKTAGVNQLNAFINKIQAFQKSGKISVTLADALIAAANQAIASATA